MGNLVCSACGYPCGIDDGSVEPELMRGALYAPFPPGSTCCGAHVYESIPDMASDLRAELARLKAENEAQRNAMHSAIAFLNNDQYATRVQNAIAELGEHLHGDENEG